MEQQVKNILDRFEQKILTYIKKECPEFIETYNENMIHEPNKSIYVVNDIIKVIFNEIYSSTRDYIGSRPHGFTLNKNQVYVDNARAKTDTSCELSVGKGLQIIAQGDSNAVDKLKTVLEALISDTELRDSIGECYGLWRQLMKTGRENEIYQLKYTEWLPGTFIKDIKYSVRDHLTNRIGSRNKL